MTQTVLDTLAAMGVRYLVGGSVASIYGKAGIPELWILNLAGGQVEVHRRPGPSKESSYGFGYVSREFVVGRSCFCPELPPAFPGPEVELPKISGKLAAQSG